MVGALPPPAAGIAAEVVEGVGDGADDVLHGQARGPPGGRVVDGHGLSFPDFG